MDDLARIRCAPLPAYERHGAAATYGLSDALHALTATLAAELPQTPVVNNAVVPDLTASWADARSMDARPISDSVPGIA